MLPTPNIPTLKSLWNVDQYMMLSYSHGDVITTRHDDNAM